MSRFRDLIYQCEQGLYQLLQKCFLSLGKKMVGWEKKHLLHLKTACWLMPSVKPALQLISSALTNRCHCKQKELICEVIGLKEWQNPLKFKRERTSLSEHMFMYQFLYHKLRISSRQIGKNNNNNKKKRSNLKPYETTEIHQSKMQYSAFNFMNDLTEETKSVHSLWIFPQGTFGKVDIPSHLILLVKMGNQKYFCSC